MADPFSAAAAWVATAVFSSATAVSVTTAATLANAAYAATYVALNVAAAAATNAVVSAASPKPKTGQGGSPVQFRPDPDAPVPFVLGEMATAGTPVFAPVSGDKNKYLNFYTVLSGLPVQGITRFTANGQDVSFTGRGAEEAVGYYENRMWQVRTLGVPGGTHLLHTAKGSKDTPADHNGNPPEWTASHRFEGMAAALWTMENDAAKFSSGVPKPLWTVQGIRCWDPVLDSTYPGGSGGCRRNDWRTWIYTQDPYLIALHWVRGFRKQNADGSLGPRIAGIGAPDAQIDIAAFVEGRNIAMANGWAIGGVVTTADDKWNALAAMLQAGGGVPLHTGARISCMVNTPKASVLTITGDDLVGEPSIDATASRRERINLIIPKYRSSLHGWQVIAGAAVTAAVYLAEDRQEVRSREIEFPYVAGESTYAAKQAGQLAAYELVNTRETVTGVLPCKPHLLGLRAGDAFTISEPEYGLNGQKCLVTRRDFDPSSGIVTLAFRSETDGKHAFALGRADAPPPSPALTGIDPAYVAAPGAGSYAAAATALTGPGGAQVGVVRVVGQSDNPGATDTIVGYRPVNADNTPAGDWVWRSYPGSSIRIDLTGLIPGGRYEIAVRYRVRGVEDPTVFRSLGIFTVPEMVANNVSNVGPISIDQLVPLLDPATIAEQAESRRAEIDALAEGSIEALLNEAEEVRERKALTHLEGRPLGAHVIEEKVKTAENIGTLNAAFIKNPDDSGSLILRSDNLVFNPQTGENLAEHIFAMETATGENRGFIEEVKRVSTENDEAMVEVVGLIGAVTPDGTAFRANTETFRVTDTQSLYDFTQYVGAQFDGTAGGSNTSFLLKTANAAATASEAAVETLDVMGALTADGKGFILDYNRVYSGPNQTLAQRDELIQAEFTAVGKQLDGTAPESSRSYMLRTAIAGAERGKAAVDVLTALGADVGNASGSIINAAKIMVTPQQSLTQNLDTTSARLGPGTATVTEQATAVVDGAFAGARFRRVVEASGGTPAVFEMFSGSTGSAFIRLLASQLWFGDNTIFYDGSNTLETVENGQRFIQGGPFGPDRLVMWIGSSGLGSQNAERENAEFFLATTYPYVGGNALATGGSFSASPSNPQPQGGGALNSRPTVGPVTVNTQGGVGTITYRWYRLSGDSDWTITSPNAQTTSFIGTVRGAISTAAFACLVTSGDGKSATVVVQAEVSNTAS